MPEPLPPDLSDVLARSVAMRRQAVEARDRCTQIRLDSATQRARARSWLTGSPLVPSPRPLTL